MRKGICKVAWLIVVLLMFVPTVVLAETKLDKEEIQKEVTDQFNQLLSAINQKDAPAWAKYYSKEDFLSAIAGTDYYGKRSAWVDLITKYFSLRERQQVQPLAIRVNALTPDLALLTSEERSEMWLKDGKNIKSKHVFSMIWKKGPEGWKILHSHESWIDEK
jgi:ketosteroid isomerase-like protein